MLSMVDALPALDPSLLDLASAALTGTAEVQDLLTPLADETLDAMDTLMSAQSSVSELIDTEAVVAETEAVSEAVAVAEAVAATLLGDEAVQEMAQTVTLVSDSASEVLANASPPALWARYLSQLASHPIRTKCITAFYLYSFSDTLTQMLLEKKPFQDVNQDRVLRFATFGILDGFMGHNWYLQLDELVERFVDDGPVSVGIRVVADQLVYVPIWYTVFFSVLGLMEGQTVSNVRRRVIDDVPGMVVTNWKVWIPVMFVSFQWVPRDLRVLWTLSVMVLYTAFLSAFTNDTDPHGLGHTADAGAAGEPTAAGSFDVQARLRGAGPQSLDVLAARERSALFLVQYFNRSLFLKHREGQAPEVVPPTVSVVNKGNRKGDSEGKVTKIFIHCTDQEGLFGAIAHALVAQGITIRNWKVEVRGEYAVSSGVVVDETGGPVTDPDTLARLHNTLELLTGQGLPNAHPAKCEDELAAARQDWRDELVESRELLRELTTEVREMPVNDAQQLVSQTSVSFATVEVSPTESADELTVTMTVEDRPGVLTRVLDELYEAHYEVKEATIRQADRDGGEGESRKLVKTFKCRRLPEVAPMSTLSSSWPHDAAVIARDDELVAPMLRSVDAAEVEGLAADLLQVVGSSLDHEILKKEAARAVANQAEAAEQAAATGGDAKLPPPLTS